MDLALRGKRILVTRASHQARDFAAEIRRRGGKPVLFPTIDIGPPDSWTRCDVAIHQIGKYGALLFTSSNGVTRFMDRLRVLNAPDPPTEIKIIAVGERTASTLKELGLESVEVPSRFSSKGLSALLNSSRIRGTKFLFPCGNLKKEEIITHIRSLGGTITPVTVYSTNKPRKANVERIRGLLKRNELDVLTFASPSAVVNFVALIPGFAGGGQNPLSAAIGKTTASALREAGIRPDIIATVSTSTGLLDAIAEYFSRPHPSR